MRQLYGIRLFAILVLLGAMPTPSHADRLSADQIHARDAFAELRRSTALVTDCERAFLSFWRVYIGAGRKGLVRTPAFAAAGDYFGYGSLASAPLLENAEAVCERQTGARGDLVVLVLKEREDAKWRRQKKLKHAERIIGY